MFAALLAAFNPAWTGIAVHEWLSVAVFVPLLFHVIINWDWTMRVIETLAEKARTTSRINLVVDVALFVATVAVVLSGLMVSRAIAGLLGIVLTPSAIWVAVHSVSANAVIALLLVHFALHVGWIADVVRRIAGAPVPARARRGHVTTRLTAPRLQEDR